MNKSPARIGYARISTADQSLDAQVAALKAAGCTMIRTETRMIDILTRQSASVAPNRAIWSIRGPDSEKTVEGGRVP